MRLTPVGVLLGSGLIALLVWSRFDVPLSIVSFDRKAIQGEFIKQLAEHKATEEQIKLASAKFSESLNQLLTHYASRHRAVVVDKNTVFAGSKDITQQITQELKQAMRHSS